MLGHVTVVAGCWAAVGMVCWQPKGQHQAWGWWMVADSSCLPLVTVLVALERVCLAMALVAKNT